jgi:hypothetical protein
VLAIMQKFWSFALVGLCTFAVSVAHAQTSVLIAASDPTQIAEVEVAKVLAADSSLWLSVRLSGQAKLAVVSSAANVEAAPASDVWLRALDFATRVRVAPPIGPLAACPQSTGKLADSGFPEFSALAPSEVSSLASDVELRRSLAAAGLAVDTASVAQFSGTVASPFRFALYEAGQSGGSTLAVRITDSGPALELPGVAAVGRASVPITLLALAPSAVQPTTANVADPSDFPVSYLGATGGTDYVAARSAWLSEDPTRWLEEARASSALFAWTVFPGVGVIEPALVHYFQAGVAGPDRQTCVSAVLAARARASRVAEDYACDGADDLSRAMTELDFGEIRVTRWFGSELASPIALGTSNDPERDSRLTATDFDSKDCSQSASVASAVGGSTLPAGSSSSPAGGEVSGGATVAKSGEDSATDASASDSDTCSGDSSGDSSSSDSCSGDSASDSGSNDSCTGDSSSDSDSKDSCSGDSSSSSSDDDSSGCGKSNYDGDTCSGSSASSANADKTSAALETSSSRGSSHRPRQVHLSLLTLFSAALALPLRRRGLSRALTT